jgi:hypothetical protein
MKTGRPLLFKTPEKLEAAIHRYFDDCDEGEERPVVDRKGNPVVDDDGEVMMAKTPVPYTMEGLALALDCDRRTITNYAHRDAYFPIITRARKRIYRDWLAGGLRVRAKISSQIFSVQAPTQQGAKIKEYPSYSVFSQRRWVGWMGAENVKLFFREPLVGDTMRRLPPCVWPFMVDTI